MSISWKNPPPVVAMGGTEDFLVTRELNRAVKVAENSGLRTEQASTDGEVVDLITGAGTFGDPCLIVVPLKEVELETVKDLLENPIERTGLLLYHKGELSEKKFPVLKEIHGAYIREHTKPTRKGDQFKLAVRFLKHECYSLLGNKDAISEALSNAVIKVVGTDLGVVSFEALKFCSLAKFRGSTEITPDIVKSLLKQDNSLDLDSLRTALKSRDKEKLALSLYRIRQKSQTDPTMLLLRGRGGPADMAFNWLLVSKLISSGKKVSEISHRTGISEWVLKKDILPVLKIWPQEKIKKLLFDLSDCENAIFNGKPSPWVACECALIKSVLQ